jgi:hypothetical protein
MVSINDCEEDIYMVNKNSRKIKNFISVDSELEAH